MGRTEVNNERTLCLLMEFEKMMLGHKSKGDVTESYIRVSPKMRARFFDYVELIVEGKSAVHGSSLRLFKAN